MVIQCVAKRGNGPTVGMRLTPALLALSCSHAATAVAAPTAPLVLTEVTRGVAFTDGGSPGRSVGDVITYAAELQDAAGVAVGHKSGRCVTESIRAGAFVARCAETIQLAGGSLYTDGTLDQSALEHGQPQALPIVGGSGIYFGKTGTQTVTQTRYPDLFSTSLNLDAWAYTR